MKDKEIWVIVLGLGLCFFFFALTLYFRGGLTL